MERIKLISEELKLSPKQVASTVELLEGGNTIPFIARYRKEKTDNLDEVQIGAIEDRYNYLKELDERRETILSSIESQGKLTPELKQAILKTTSKQVLEDLYLPYKPKRRTRATIARELGLQPLADLLRKEDTQQADLQAWLTGLNQGQEQPLTLDEALKGARDILAEETSEDAEVRELVRSFTWKVGVLQAVKRDEFTDKKTKFDDYHEFSESVGKIAPHRYLALRRGEKEKVLRVKLEADTQELLEELKERFIQDTQSVSAQQMELALEDSINRLMMPSIETEIRLELKNQADETSIELFSQNLRELLLSPPGGSRTVLGLDPGIRTGTKWVVVDPNGTYKEQGVIFPIPPQNQVQQSVATLKDLIKRYQIDVIAIGNGTASREVHQFVRSFVKAAELSIHVLMVNESGASVYSASEVAREEFPDLDATVRGAISIARRYQDPLAELVKIDPKSIGVGQYQHDVNQPRLKQSLDRTVESCVNYVGVELNTASHSLLSYVAGISRNVAMNIVKHRNANGSFRSRTELLKVSGVGPRLYEQAAGFLRIRDAQNVLDRTAVHPENYPLVEKIAESHQLTVEALMANQQVLDAINLSQFESEQAGRYTLRDILEELRKPGRDPRADQTSVQFDESVHEPKDLKEGMRLPGVITNITHFGAFVDVGVHQDGLVHISELSDQYVKNPLEVCSVGQKVQVTVLEVDLDRKRIALSMKSQSSGKPRNKAKKAKQSAQKATVPNLAVHAKEGSGDFKSDLAALMTKFNQ